MTHWSILYIVQIYVAHIISYMISSPPLLEKCIFKGKGCILFKEGSKATFDPPPISSFESALAKKGVTLVDALTKSVDTIS